MRLPLAERAARRLSAVLLEEDAERRRAGWREFLIDQPEWLAWAEAARSGGASASSESPSAADWCAEHAPTYLARLERDGAEGDASPSADDGPDSAELLVALARRWERLREGDDARERRLQTMKLDALKELAYGASHEINNPLANIATRAQALMAEERDDERRKKLATIAAQAYRAHEMISDLMLFARPPAPRPERVDVAELAERVLREFSERAAAEGVEVSASGPVDLAWRLDATQIAAALQALVRNAFEALAGRGGRIEVAWELVESSRSSSSSPASARASGERLRFRVRDDGPGVSERAAAHLFDPFFSGREAGRGLGFGLSKAWRIATAHGGELRHVATPERRGATFTLDLPDASP